MNEEYNQDVDQLNQEALTFCREFGVGYSNFTHLLSKGFVIAPVDPTDPESPKLFAPKKMIEEMRMYYEGVLNGLSEDNRLLRSRLVSSPAKPPEAAKVAIMKKEYERSSMVSKGQLIYEGKRDGITWMELGREYESKQPLNMAKRYAISRKLPFPPVS